MTRTTRAPTIFGAILMLAGSLLYLIDIDDSERNLHWFLIPAVVLMGLGAVFAVLGARGNEESGSSTT
jgi:uncharacterized membrane protein